MQAANIWRTEVNRFQKHFVTDQSVDRKLDAHWKCRKKIIFSLSEFLNANATLARPSQYVCLFCFCRYLLVDVNVSHALNAKCVVLLCSSCYLFIYWIDQSKYEIFPFRQKWTICVVDTNVYPILHDFFYVTIVFIAYLQWFFILSIDGV